MALTLLYGGTFDPVHAGHLAVAQAARSLLDADVAFVPAADPPHRAAPGASAAQRAHMLDLAVAGRAGLTVDRRELQRAGLSYTADTLRALRAERGPAAPLAWLVGADAFRGLAGWHDWRNLFELAHFVVAVRPGHALDPLPQDLAHACAGRWTARPGDLIERPAGRLLPLPMALHPASATELRRRLRAGEPPGEWLDARVEAFIQAQGLYRGGDGPGGV